MEKLEGFELSVGVTRKVMNITGVWPGTPRNISWHRRYQFLVPLFLLVFFLNIPQTYMLFIVWNNFEVVIDILCTGDLMFGLTCFKLLGIWYNKVDLNYILIKMSEDWEKTEKEKLKVMWINAKISNLVITSFVTLAIVTVVIYGIQMLVFTLSTSTMSDGNETSFSYFKQLLFVSKFPFNTDVRPVYEVIWIFQFLSTITAGLVFTSFDSFFIFSILHLCGQLTNLRSDVKHLNVLFQTTRKTFANLLRKIVERHIQLNRFTNCIEKSFNIILLIEMLGFSVTFCLQGYQFVEILTNNQDTNIGDLIFIISFTITTTLSIFLYCLIVEKLRDESSKFSYSFYDINWYNLKSCDSKMLINIAHVTKNPPTLTAGKFFEFSLEYFMTLMKTSLGYLSMLLAVKKRFQE